MEFGVPLGWLNRKRSTAPENDGWTSWYHFTQDWRVSWLILSDCDNVLCGTNHLQSRTDRVSSNQLNTIWYLPFVLSLQGSWNNQLTRFFGILWDSLWFMDSISTEIVMNEFTFTFYQLVLRDSFEIPVGLGVEKQNACNCIDRHHYFISLEMSLSLQTGRKEKWL